MTNIAIICEYNPFHNGHLFQIRKIKEQFPESKIIALMSSSFVQRGEPSIFDKFTRGKIAMENGIDLVLELPTFISLQSADIFAYNSVKLLDSLGNIDYLSFGIEEADESVFIQTSNLLFDLRNEIEQSQIKYIKKGLSYKASYLKSLEEYNLDSNSLSKPNNTLGYLYSLALKEFKSNIKILPILREDGGYNSENLDSFEFQSATTIRNLLKTNIDFSKYVPKNSLDRYFNTNLKNIDNYNDIFYFKAIVEKRNAENILGYENGILNLLVKNFTGSIFEMIELSHNKRYSKSRLRRFVINYLLDINDKYLPFKDSISYIRPLYFNNSGTQLLKELKSNSNIEIVKKPNILLENKINQLFLDLDNKANALYFIKDIEKTKLNYTENPFYNN